MKRFHQWLKGFGLKEDKCNKETYTIIFDVIAVKRLCHNSISLKPFVLSLSRYECAVGSKPFDKAQDER